MGLAVMVVLLAWQLPWAQDGPAAAANVPGYQEGLEKLSALDFERAYLVLRGVGRNRGPDKQSEEAEVLRTIIALGETVAHVRLFHAYTSLIARLSRPARVPVKEEGLIDALQSYAETYRQQVRRWADRLAGETGTIKDLARDIPVSIPYPGLRDLPNYVQRGFDRLQVLREGIVPLPSQAANIEQAEEYAAVLAGFYLAIDQEFILPIESTSLRGRVHRSHLLFYSALWLSKVSDILHAARFRKAAAVALDVVLELEASKPASILNGRARALQRRLGEGPDI